MVVFWWMNDWSILSASLSPLEGEPQAALKRLPLAGLPVHVRREELEIIAPAFLGVVHGCIRTLDEHFRIASVRRVNTDTDAAADRQFLSPEGCGAS